MLDRRNDASPGDILRLRTEYLNPDDIYLATIDMSNGANTHTRNALVNVVRSTPGIHLRTLQRHISDTLCNANELFRNTLASNLIDWAIGNKPNQTCSSTGGR